MLLRRPIPTLTGWARLPPTLAGSTAVSAPAPAGATIKSFSPAPRAGAPPLTLAGAASAVWVRQIVDVLNTTQRGKLNATTAITFNTDADATLLIHPLIGPNSFILLMPTTADAASLDGLGWYVTAQKTGSALINHPNSPLADRSYTVLIVG